MMPVKTKSVFFLLWVAVFSLFTSCKNNDETDNVIWDIAPIEFHIYVEDAAGRDLLNPETENNILEQDIRAIYDQKSINWVRNRYRHGLSMLRLWDCKRPRCSMAVIA